jgi:hypothetical protein
MTPETDRLPSVATCAGPTVTAQPIKKTSVARIRTRDAFDAECSNGIGRRCRPTLAIGVRRMAAPFGDLP